METLIRTTTTSSQEQRGVRGLVAWACAIASVLALSILIVAVPNHKAHHNAVVVSRTTAKSSPSTPSQSSIAAICRPTPYPSACESALSSVAAAVASSRDPFAVSVQFAMGRAASARAMAHNLSASARGLAPPPQPASGMDDCAELLDITLQQLADSLAGDGGADAHGVQTWLSAALTNQDTCAESLARVPASAGRNDMRNEVDNLAQYISKALAMQNGGNAPPAAPAAGQKFPSWVSLQDRKLLEASARHVRADAVVALDGSGTHRSIGEAIASVAAAAAAAADAGGGGRRVIYVKAGTYEESVRINYNEKNVVLMGDGKGRTVIVGRKSAADGYTTYASATVAAMGGGFIAKGLSIVNNAGPGRGQAVALRVGGDLSVVYDCSIEGFQDTLYTHSNRQFFSAADIAGTVDFVFGNAAAVLQSCVLRPRRPSPGQKDTVTAQGRTDPHQNTGISIHRCRLAAAQDLGGTPVYLGRPWRRYSRTVVMESFLDRSVAPAGWLAWAGSFALDTLYYGEYGNYGPGAATGGRVRWAGVHPAMSAAEAAQFTVAQFIMGDAWLRGTGVSYSSGL